MFGLLRGFCLLSTSKRTIPSCVVYRNIWLDIVAIYIKANAISIVLNRVCFQQNTACKEIVAFKNWRRTIKDMISGFFHIVCNHTLEWQHSLNV